MTMNKKAPATANSETNRRNYFRVNQDVIFHCRLADSYGAQHGSPNTAFEDVEGVTLAAQLSRIDQQSVQFLNILAEKDRDLGDYLRLLNQKIDLVARQALREDGSEHSDSPARINLSETGIAFESRRAYYKGTFLAIRLIFLPGYVTLTSFAEVVRCENRGTRGDTASTVSHTPAAKADADELDEVFQVAARFHRLSKQDRQVLSRQIIRAQRAVK